ncbi:MAG TPA: TonB family protein, partial [Kofleriaceae bacterium]|nr:TonB family protein [Kofleriaceae bacterium]
MRGCWFVVAMVAACGHPAATLAPQTTPSPTVMRLRPPPALDPDVRGSAYLATVALQLQPGWGQFLDDCRLRLPATHPLNDFALVTTAELAIDAHGQVVDVKVAGSGNADFDRAVRDALRDVSPLPAPPHELWSDDDRVHLSWLFARDRRQAGPATAHIVDVELPLESVVDRLVRTRDFARAAQRIIRAPAGDAARERATKQLAVASLRDSLDSSDSTVRRSAVDAIRRAQVTELVPDIRALLSSTNDSELRIAAMQAVTAFGDDASAAVILEQLKHDIVENGRLARAEMQALVGLHRERDLAGLLRSLLDHAKQPDPVALEGVGLVAIPELTTQIGAWFTRGDAKTRVAACSALASAAADDKKANAVLVKGIGDRDASVRTACITSLHDSVAASARKQLRTL